jgi:hypothetical protein
MMVGKRVDTNNLRRSQQFWAEAALRHILHSRSFNGEAKSSPIVLKTMGIFVYIYNAVSWLPNGPTFYADSFFLMEHEGHL